MHRVEIRPAQKMLKYIKKMKLGEEKDEDDDIEKDSDEEYYRELYRRKQREKMSIFDILKQASEYITTMATEGIENIQQQQIETDKVKEELKDAIEARDLNRLNEAIKKADSMNINGDELLFALITRADIVRLKKWYVNIDEDSEFGDEIDGIKKNGFNIF